MPDWMIERLVNFAEENWVAFTGRTNEAGIPEEDVEAEIDEWKQSTGRC